MKKTTYLIVAMLMAFTMVGCQVDLSDYLTKEEAANTYATKSYVDGKVAELETKISDIDAKFEKYYTKVEVDAKGFVTKEELGTLEVISNAVKDYLNSDEFDLSKYVDTGYTNAEIDAKLKEITDITDKLAETYATLEKVTELSTKVTSLETTVTTLGGKVTTLENKPAPSGNGGDGYCGLSADEVTNIKTLLTQWANNNISGVVYSLAGYVKETDLADYVKTENLPSLADYAKKTDIKDFTSDIATLTSRITTVENMLKADGTFGQKLAELETKVNNTNATEVTELKNTVDTIKAWYEANKDKVTNLNLADYLTVANAENTYATKSSVESVETVASSLAELTSRVETLEELLDTESDFMKSISTMKLVLGNTESGLVKNFNDLKNAVKENTDKLAYKIGDEDYSIEKLAEKVKALYEVKDAYKSYCDSAVSGLATLTEVNEKLEGYVKTDMTNVDKQTVVNLVKEYVEGKVAEVTVDTSDFLTSDSLSNYATKTDLANYLTSESQIIKDLTSGLATWNVKKGKYVDTEHLTGCAYYLINDSICIGYDDIAIYEDSTFDVLIQYATAQELKVVVGSKNDMDKINRNVVFE